MKVQSILHFVLCCSYNYIWLIALLYENVQTKNVNWQTWFWRSYWKKSSQCHLRHLHFPGSVGKQNKFQSRLHVKHSQKENKVHVNTWPDISDYCVQECQRVQKFVFWQKKEVQTSSLPRHPSLSPSSPPHPLQAPLPPPPPPGRMHHRLWTVSP